MKPAMLLLAVLLSACAESPSEPTPTPQPTATVSGVVRDDAGDPIEGASVKSGSAIATTDADGHFTLQDLPVGVVTIVTSAPRFDAQTQNVNLSEGANALDFMLTPQTIFTYGNVLAYLPSAVTEYKVAVVFLPGLQDPATGNPLDSRPLVSGAGGMCAIWCLASEQTEVRNRALGVADGQVALIGSRTLVDNAASYQTLLSALTAFGTQSLHPELADIPIVLVGHSMGGCTAYGFTRAHGARVAGFMTMKGGCHNPGPAADASGVPGYFLIGALDEQYRRDNITGVFEAGREGGAPWAVSIDELGHNPIADMDMLFDWIDAVLAARLPETAGAPLRAVNQAAGWLGNRTTGAIATHACYSATPTSAVWLPSEATALNWQRMAGGTEVKGSC